MFYHGCSSTLSWGSVLPSIVESIAVLPHSPGAVYYHLLLRQETIIHGLPPSLRNLGSFCAFYTPTAFRNLWTTQGVRYMPYTFLIIIHDPGMRPGLESNRGPLDLRMSALQLNYPPHGRHYFFPLTTASLRYVGILAKSSKKTTWIRDTDSRKTPEGGGGGGSASMKVATHCQTTHPAFQVCLTVSFL